MASRRYRGRNSLNGNVTHSNARLSSIEKRSIPTTISAGAIDGALLAESSVTSINLAPNSVQGENIATGAVNTGNLADASVTSAKLAPDALAGIEVGENSVDTAQLVDDAVTNIKIRDGAINNAKITSLSGSKINEGTVAATYIGDLDAGKITSGTFNINRIPDVSSKVSSLGPESIGSGTLNLGGSGVVIAGYYGNIGDVKIGFDDAYTIQGVRTPYLHVRSSTNLSGSTSVSSLRANSPIFVGDDTAGLGIDANQINTSGNLGVYINGNGSSGNVVLGDGGGDTLVRNGLTVTSRITSPQSFSLGAGVGRVPLYVGSGGLFGFNSSTATVKQDIVDADLNVEAILSINPKYFRYIEEVEAFGEDAVVEVGFIAEDFLAAGLDKYVFLDEEGAPKGIRYELLTTALQAVVKDQSSKIASLESSLSLVMSRLEALEAKVE